MISDPARIHNDVPEVHFDSDGFDNLEICHSVPLLTMPSIISLGTIEIF